MQSNRSYKRHVPVKGQRGIYWSGYERNKRFEIRFSDGSGKRKFEVVGSSLAEAKARLAEVTVARQRGERMTRLGMTFAECVEEWCNVRLVKPSTADTYDRLIRLYLMPRFGRTRVSDIDTLVLRSWLGRLERETKLSSSSRQLILSILSAVLAHAVEEGALTANPVSGLTRRVRPTAIKLDPRILSREEEAPLLAACGRREWMVPVVRVALLTGLRLGEICGLQWEDVDLEAGKLNIRHNLSKDSKMIGTPKGGPAIIDLHPEVRRILVELRMASPAGAEYVFVNRLGQRRMPREVQRAWTDMVGRAGLSKEPRHLRFHDLRHTCASRLANATGASMPWVQGYLRHANMQTTLGYVHSIADEARLAAAWEALA
jgi:integrase